MCPKAPLIENHCVIQTRLQAASAAQARRRWLAEAIFASARFVAGASGPSCAASGSPAAAGVPCSDREDVGSHDFVVRARARVLCNMCAS